MKCKIPVFTTTTLLFATLAVAQPAEAPSERELLCKDLVAFAFPESDTIPLLRSGLLVEQSGDSSDIFTRTFYPEEGLPHLRTRGLSRWGLRDHSSPRYQGYEDPGSASRGLARLDRARRNQTTQEQIRVLYNICSRPLAPSR